MKTKSIIVALLLALVLALSAFVACDKQGAEHKSDGVYQSDDAYHWHACGECSFETFDFGVHVFTSYSGGNKICECGYATEVTEEENYKAFVMARDGSDASENVYYYKSVEQSNNLTSGDVQTSTVQETRLGVDGTVRFVYKAEVEGVVKN